MCNCKSYNRPDETGTDETVVVTYPFSGETVCLDKCIIDMVLDLWVHHIPTGGSCCGHNGVFGNASVILINLSDVEKAKNILNSYDKQMDVLCWELKNFSELPQRKEK